MTNIKMLAGPRPFYVRGQRVAAGVQFDCALAIAVDLVDNGKASPFDAAGSAAIAGQRKVERNDMEARLQHETRRERLRVA